jgi:hypothetical protein
MFCIGSKSFSFFSGRNLAKIRQWRKYWWVPLATPPPPGGRGEGGKCTASQLSTCLCHLLFTRAALRASKLLRCGYVPSGHFSYLTDRCPWHYWTRVTSRFNHPCCIIILCGCHVLVELGRVWREIKRNVCFCFTYALFWLFGQKSQLTARPPPLPLSPFTARSQNIPLATFAICTWELKIRRVKRKLEKKKTYCSFLLP